MNSDPLPLTCEVLASTAAKLGALSEIARVVARDTRHDLTFVSRGVNRSIRHDVIVINLSAEQAVQATEVWCFACRLACFCPNARVSVLIQAEDAFRPAVNPVAAQA